MTKKAIGVPITLVLCLVASVWTVKAAEPSFELTARYILEVVKAFRTAYVLKVVEHAKDGGIRPNEEWQKDSHFIPLPAQFVKAAAAISADLALVQSCVDCHNHHPKPHGAISGDGMSWAALWCD